MRAKSSAARTMQLFDDEPMTLERALQIAERVPLRATISFRQWKQGPARRTYRAWKASWSTSEGTAHRHIGDDAKKREIDRAHALLRRLIHEAEAAAARLPEVARLRELRRMAGAKESDDDGDLAVVRVLGEVK